MCFLHQLSSCHTFHISNPRTWYTMLQPLSSIFLCTWSLHFTLNLSLHMIHSGDLLAFHSDTYAASTGSHIVLGHFMRFSLSFTHVYGLINFILLNKIIKTTEQIDFELNSCNRLRNRFFYIFLWLKNIQESIYLSLQFTSTHYFI